MKIEDVFRQITVRLVLQKWFHHIVCCREDRGMMLRGALLIPAQHLDIWLFHVCMYVIRNFQLWNFV